MEASGAFFRHVVESSPDGIWAIDLTGRTVYANARAAELLGRDAATMRSLTVFDALDDAGREQFRAHLRHVAENGLNDGEVECCYLRSDGCYVQLVVSEGPLVDEEGRLVGLVHRMTDDMDRRALIDELSHSSEQLDEAQSIARMGSYELDVTTGDLQWSRQMFRLFDEDPDTATASVETFTSWVVEEDRHLVREGIEEALAGSGDHETTVRIRRKDGSVGWYRGRNRILQVDDEGRPVRLGGTVQDVTDVKEAEAELLDAVALNSLLQVIVADANSSDTVGEALRRIRGHLLAGDDWDRVVGFRRDDTGRLSAYLVDGPEHVPDAHELAVADRALATGEVVLDESRPLAPSLGFLVGTPGEEEVVVVLRGRGPIRRPWMVRALVAQVADQVGRVAERERDARELAAARDAAMEASRLKSDFLATMSHEIRTPMNGVIGLNELLLQTPLDVEQRRLARGVQVAGRTLLQLINDILDFSKIEAGELELESVPFDVAEVVHESVGLVRASAADRGIRLAVRVEPDVPARVVGDPTRLGQVLANLLSNAVKFTHEGRVEVEVEVVGRRGCEAVLQVRVCDTGIGIGQAQRERLFEPFRQADASTTRTYGGTGLGLAIAKRLTQALGGEIGVDSEPGAGSTFWFTFTATVAEDRDQPSAPVRPEPEGTGPSRGRILVVEDNEINQMVTLGLLDALGYTGEVACNGAEAVETAARGGFDAVLMDLRMPVMDGFTAARRIRAAETGRRVPIIALTASAITGERERCLAAGMDDFLGKPVNRDQLAAALRQQVDDPAERLAGGSAGSDHHPVEAAEPGPPAEPVLDGTRLDELLAMGPRAVPIVARAVGNFTAGLPDTLAELERARDAADARALRDTAHRLKGSALNLGARRVATLSYSVEQLGDAGDTASAGPAIEQLRRVADDTSAALSAYLATHVVEA